MTEMYSYLAAVTPGVPETQRLSKANDDAWAPRWKGTVGLNWSSGPYSVSATGRYIGEYLDYQDAGPTTRQLGNIWFCDLNARYEVGKALARTNSAFAGSVLSAGVVNAFNSLPAYSNYNGGIPGYDPAEYDIIGRLAYVNVALSW